MPRRTKSRKAAARSRRVQDARRSLPATKPAVPLPPATLAKITVHVAPRPEPWFPRKASLAVLAFVALAAVPEVVPGLANQRIVEWGTVLLAFDLAPKRPAADQVVEDQAPIRAQIRASAEPAPPLVADANQLDAFYSALFKTEQRRDGAVTRILHYGDSPTTADMITADVRAQLQKQYGDAGHGFYLIDKPWAWYGHRGLDIRGAGWKIEPANQAGLRDGAFGIGGVSFTGAEGAHASASVREPGHTRLEVSYLKQPGGGAFGVWASGALLGEVDTESESREPDYAGFDLPPAARTYEIRVLKGRVRLFGVSIEKPGPGVVYHSLGLNGAFVNVLSRMFNEAHWAGQLRHYRPDLIVINYGTNESGYADFIETGYRQELKEVIRRVRAALPGSSLLVMSPMDRGRREPGGEIGTVPVLPRLVSMQQEIATGAGCAFFNTFQAMGGPGTMGRWYEAEPRLVGGDFIHPMPAGAKIVGNHLYRALMDGYNRYKMRRIRNLASASKPETL